MNLERKQSSPSMFPTFSTAFAGNRLADWHSAGAYLTFALIYHIFSRH